MRSVEGRVFHRLLHPASVRTNTGSVLRLRSRYLESTPQPRARHENFPWARGVLCGAICRCIRAREWLTPMLLVFGLAATRPSPDLYNHSPPLIGRWPITYRCGARRWRRGVEAGMNERANSSSTQSIPRSHGPSDRSAAPVRTWLHQHALVAPAGIICAHLDLEVSAQHQMTRE